MKIFPFFIALLILAFGFFIMSMSFPGKEIVTAVVVGLFFICLLKVID